MPAERQPSAPGVDGVLCEGNWREHAFYCFSRREKKREELIDGLRSVIVLLNFVGSGMTGCDCDRGFGNPFAASLRLRGGRTEE